MFVFEHTVLSCLELGAEHVDDVIRTARYEWSKPLVNRYSRSRPWNKELKSKTD
jgi:hypothetical protein